MMKPDTKEKIKKFLRSSQQVLNILSRIGEFAYENLAGRPAPPQTWPTEVPRGQAVKKRKRLEKPLQNLKEAPYRAAGVRPAFSPGIDFRRELESLREHGSEFHAIQHELGLCDCHKRRKR